MKKVKVLDVQFDACTMQEATRRVEELLTAPGANRPHGVQIVTPNPEMLLAAQRNQSLRDVLNKAWLSIPDGIGILWAATFAHYSARTKSSIVRWIKGLWLLIKIAIRPASCTKIFPERVTGVDLMQHIAVLAARHKKSIFLLGAGTGIAEKAALHLKKNSPSLHIVGTFAGSPHEDDFAVIHSRIAEAQPDILFVAYGSPAQELWIAQNLATLKGVKVAMGVGGAFDFIAGVRKRAPGWMRKIGLEWLWRLIQEPSRWKRIWNATVKFPMTVIGISSNRSKTI